MSAAEVKIFCLVNWKGQSGPMLAKGWGQIVTPLSVQTAGGRQKMNCATIKGIFRIIQAIPSPKAEPLKNWIAQVASERLDQMQDPEKSIDQAIVDYKRLGYSGAWINQRIKSIEVRKELTDEWQRTGVHEGLEDTITKQSHQLRRVMARMVGARNDPKAIYTRKYGK